MSYGLYYSLSIFSDEILVVRASAFKDFEANFKHWLKWKFLSVYSSRSSPFRIFNFELYVDILCQGLTPTQLLVQLHCNMCMIQHDNMA